MEGLVPLETPSAGFAEAFGFDPRGVQAQAAADDLGPVALIEAETGSGKTEAALWRWLGLSLRSSLLSDCLHGLRVDPIDGRRDGNRGNDRQWDALMRR